MGPQKKTLCCAGTQQSLRIWVAEKTFFIFFLNIFKYHLNITDLLLLFSIAWCSTLGGAACVAEPDRLRVVR